MDNVKTVSRSLLLAFIRALNKAVTSGDIESLKRMLDSIKKF